MAKKKPQVKLGRMELEIMHIVWEKGEVSVRDIFRIMNKKREFAYTTILTVARSLEKKGFVSHHTEQRKFIYKALVTKDEVETSLLNNLVESAFKGSHGDVVTSLIKNKNISIEELKDLIISLENEKK